MISGISAEVVASGDNRSCGLNMSIALWAEWLVCVPMMTYVIVVCRKHISSNLHSRKHDLRMVPAMFLCILFGMLSQLVITEWACYTFLAMSHFSIAYCFVITFYIRNSISPTEEPADSYKENLWSEFLVLMLPFPAIYCLGLAQVLTDIQTMIAFSVANIVVKYLFSSRFVSNDSQLKAIFVNIFS